MRSLSTLGLFFPRVFFLFLLPPSFKVLGASACVEFPASSLAWVVSLATPLLLCSLALLVADSPLRTNPVGIIFYLVFAAYFLVGTLQLFYGFPRSPPENSLMSKGYDPPIPLLYRCVA